MKELKIGEISIYSEEGDSWDELLRVAKKAKKIYIDSIKALERSWIKRMFSKIFYT